MAARRPVRLSGRLGHACLAPPSGRLFPSRLLAPAHLVPSRALVSSRITRRRPTAWAAPGIASARPGEWGLAVSRVTSETADLSPPRSSSWSQSLPGAPRSLPSVTAATRLPSTSAIADVWRRPLARAVSSMPTLVTPGWSAPSRASATARPSMAHILESDSRTCSETALTDMPDIAITSTCASNRAVKCELGRASRGALAVPGPCSGQLARGTRQCATVLNRQMSRWRQVSSRASQAPRRAPRPGHATAAPGTLPTRTCGSSSPDAGDSNQTSSTRRSGPGPVERSKSLAGIPA